MEAELCLWDYKQVCEAVKVLGKRGIEYDNLLQLLQLQQQDKQPQKNDFQFFFQTVCCTVSNQKHEKIAYDSLVKDSKIHNVIRLFGSTPHPPNEPEGFSVVVNVHGYVPYMYMMMKKPADEWGSQEISKYCIDKEKEISAHLYGYREGSTVFSDFFEGYDKGIRPCVRIEELRGEMLKNVRNERMQNLLSIPKYSNFVSFKVTVALTEFVPKVSLYLQFESIEKEKLMEKKKQQRTNKAEMDSHPFQGFVFESDVPSHLQLLADQTLRASSWLTLKGGRYYLRVYSIYSLPKTTCTVELDIFYSELSASCRETIDLQPPAIRVVGLDIETRVFPVPLIVGEAEVIAIGMVLTRFYRGRQTELGRVVFTLGTCANIHPIITIEVGGRIATEYRTSDATNLLPQKEAEMLILWKSCLAILQPDILSGHNLIDFDLPHIFIRMRNAAINMPHLKEQLIMDIGRLINEPIKVTSRVPRREATSWHQEVYVSVPGCITMDSLSLMRRHYNAPKGQGHTLLELSNLFLPKDSQKLDMEIKDVNRLLHLGPVGRSVICVYCVADALSSQKLLVEKLSLTDVKGSILEHYLEESRTSGVPLDILVSKRLEFAEWYRNMFEGKNQGRMLYDGKGAFVRVEEKV